MANLHFLKNILNKVIPKRIILIYHKTLAVLANIFYRFPSRKLIIIGVTGTNGKTTSCNLIWNILKAAGFKSGLATSINFKIGDKAWVNRTKQGMQGRFRLQRLLRSMVDNGCKYAVIETTSEGIKQFRHWGILYDVCVFTNLTPEHIESHGGFDKYKMAKGKMFAALYDQPLIVKILNDKKVKKVIVANIDDEHSDFFLGFKSDEKWVYGIRGNRFNEDKEYKALYAFNLKLSPLWSEFDVFIDSKRHRFKIKLLGKFNIYNSLAACAVCLSLGIDIETIKKALFKSDPMPGRMEVIYDKSKDITFIVDYAHDPSALLNVYKTIESFYSKKEDRHKSSIGRVSNLIAVLGAVGGGRDVAKRPKLGRLASKYAKYVVITNEDPYDDDPLEIMDQVEAGVLEFKERKKEENYWKILDRREAIKKAVDISSPGDIIALTGKGCEEIMAVKGGFIPWDDREVVKEVLNL